MRLSVKTYLLAIVTTSLLTSSTLADQGQFYLAPGVQWMEFDDSMDIDEEYGWFLGLGYDFTDALSGEISTFDIDSEDRAGRNIDLDHYKVDLFYDFGFDLGFLDTFIVGGFGNTNFQGDNDTLFDYGAGIQYDFNDRISWRTAVRSFNYLGRDFEDNDFGIDSSLIIYFGGKKSSPARRSERSTSSSTSSSAAATTQTQVADADRDGVADARDNCPDTPRTYAVDANGCPIAVEEVARVELLVNFDFDKSEVKPQYFSEIEEVADFMRQYSDVVVELEGHTDGQGTDQYNQGLSERRASAVRQVLIDEYSVQGSRVSAAGFGEAQPVASNNSSAGRAQNRRVITVIIKTLQNYQPR